MQDPINHIATTNQASPARATARKRIHGGSILSLDRVNHVPHSYTVDGPACQKRAAGPAPKIGTEGGHRMTWSSKPLSVSACLGVVAIVAASGLAIPQARAQCCVVAIPDDVTDFAFLYADPNLRVINADISGNVGIAEGGGFIGFGSGMVTGQVRFAVPATAGSCSDPDGVTVTGGTTFGNANVQADFDAVTMMSRTLGAERGKPITIMGGGSVYASTGKMDSAGNRVFTATLSEAFTAGTTFTIHGSNSDRVVINIPSTDGHGFDGSIVLEGGITPDHVLFNFHKGDFATLAGGDTLMINTDGNPTTGMFVNINGNFIVTNSMIFGRVFGGGSEFNSTIQTMNPTNPDFRTNIVAPPLFPTPEPPKRRRKAD
jgi:choice-of-anchor A domain-containing protein